MAKSIFSKTSFILGEISPRAFGRYETEKPIFRDGAGILENFLIFQDGGAFYRPGSGYIATAGQVNPVRLDTFQYSLLQQYILEFGNQYIQFYANSAQLFSNSVAVKITSPYFQPDIFKLQMSNKQDVSYIAHPNYPVYKLVRTSATSFTIQPVQFIGGPFLSPNVGNVTITASATTGSVTLTATIPAWASNTQYIPGDYVTNGGNTYLCIQSNLSAGTLNAPASPTTFANDNSNGGTLAWGLTSPWTASTTTPSNIVLSEYLKFTNLGFNIPSTATILGVVVNITRQANYIGGNPFVSDSSIKLIKGGTIGGTDHSAGANWSSTSTLASFGSASDLWGETLLYSDINNANFGVAISASFAKGALATLTATISSISITVYYTSANFSNDLAAGYWQLSSGFFQSGHIGSLWSVGAGTPNATPPEPAGTVVITGYTSTTVVTGYVQNNPDGTAGAISTTSPTTVWSEGAFSGVRGYPSAVTFHEGRLIFANTNYQQKTAWASVVGSYEDFSKGQATDSDAWTYTATDGDAIQWMKSIMVNGTTALRMGTSGGCVTWFDGSQSGITPSSPPEIVTGPDYQVQNILPKAISSYVFYMQGNSYQLRQLVYDFTIGADKSEDMNLLADHVLRNGGGTIQMARQESPNDRIWCVRQDGQMAIMTRNVEQQVTGWTRMVSGLTSGGNGIYNSVAIIPQVGGDDQVWVAVTRMINGVQQQFIEMFTPELFNNPWEPNRLDASLQLNNPITITAITNASVGVFTSPNHGLSNGQQIRLDNIVGMNWQATVAPSTILTTQSLNGLPYLVQNVTTNTFTLTDLNGNVINTSKYTSFMPGSGPTTTAQFRIMNTVFSGLPYLNGENVSVVADGSPLGLFLVQNGQITIANPAAVVTVGLPYTGTLQFLPLGEPSQGVVSQMMKRKIYEAKLRVWQSSGATFGDAITHQFKQIPTTQNPNAIPAKSPQLYTGDINLDFESFFAENWAPYIIQTQPLPYMVLAIMVRSDIQSDK